jgi:hypothetical protein
VADDRLVDPLRRVDRANYAGLFVQVQPREQR